jgi:CheY-like chemotaxis protein
MSSRTLLYIDDRSPLLQIRKADLEHLGYSVVTATNALAAIATLEKTAVAAVLIEYKSEGVDAEAIALHVKQRFPRQPIILLSAYFDLPERVLWLVDEYVMRSEPLEALEKVIERVTHTYAAGEAHKPPLSLNQPLKRGRAIA